MKRKIYYVLLAALLLSANVFSAQVAKLGDTNYEDIAAAISDWKTNGGELQLLSDATYNTTKIDTLTKDATLNLNGKTLTWNANFGSLEKKVLSIPALFVQNGTFTIKASAADDATQKGTLALNVSHNQSTNLCAILVGMTQTTTAKLVATDGVNITGNFVTAPEYTYNTDGTPKSQTYLTSSIIYPYRGALDIENANIRMQGECGYALNIYSKAGEIVCTNNTITYVAGTPTLCLNYCSGINAGKAGVLFENNKVDMSAAKGGTYISSSKSYEPYISALKPAAKITVKGSESLYKADVAASKHYCVYGGSAYVVSIEDGTFIGAQSAGFSISGGKFSHQPDVKNFVAGSYCEKEGEYWVVKHGKSYAVRINDVDYFNTDDWGSVCSHSADTYTTVLVIAHDNFTIPEGVYIYLNFGTATDADNLAGMTITNNGTTRLGGRWKKGTFVNNGTLEICEYSTLGKKNTTPMSITNNATGKLSIQPSNSTTNSTTTFENYFTLTNNGGQVSVSAGKFTAKAFAQISNYIAEGYVSPKQDATYYYVMPADAIVATVNGVEYETLYKAIKASSAAYPAILQKDYTQKGKLALTSMGVSVLDLNGKVLTLDYSELETGAAGFVNVYNTNLTIQGTGMIVGNGDILFSMQGGSKVASTNYSVLSIGKDVTIRQTAGWYIIAASYTTNTYGIVVNFDGKVEQTQCAFEVVGLLDNTSATAPIFNIGSTAEFNCSESVAYAAGYARWTYAGKATVGNYGFEMRAGELTMNGGSIICTATQPADDQFNGSGSTSQATAIAACQHSTKLPIKVLVKGGLLKAYTPIYQANPQNNEQEAIDKVSVVVNNAQVFSTSKNIVWSANKKVVLNGGVYNLSPSQYVADGKVVVANEDAATKDEYPYTIGDKPADITFTTAGDWSTAANWSNTTGSTSATPVMIAANVVIPDGVTAEAYGITVAEGKTITIKAGGKLLVGKEGIAGLSGADQLKIEDGGILAISPAAESNNQPQASVEKYLNTYKKVVGSYVEGVEDEFVRCYMGSVTTGKPVVTKPVEYWYGNYWDYSKGWQQTSLSGISILCEPFRGFAVATETESAPTTPVTMQGTLVGNSDAHLSMPGEGFHFFANSWMAPLDAYEVLNQLDKLRNEGKVESSIKILLPLDVTIGGDDWSAGTFVDINRSFLRLGDYSQYWGTIASMAGFFLRANEPVNIDLTYENAVWNALQASSTPSKSVRRSSESAGITGVQIRLTASDGSKDRLYVFNGDPIESCTKMMNDVPNVNIYVANAGGKYSTYATEDLSGTEIGIQSNSSTEYVLSFGYTEGELLYLQDLQTGIVTEMSEGNSYTFTADANTTTNRFRIVSRSEVTTGVDGTTAETTAATAKGIYSVTGQYLGDADQQSALPAGVYIINGKKVVK